MEKTASPPSDTVSASAAPSPVLQSPPLSSSPPLDYQTRQFASNFTTLYHSIFPPKPSQLPTSLSLSLSITPSTSSPSSATTVTDDFATENRLHQARLILEYQELCDHYEISLARLQTLTEELESLRQENIDLRLANNELVKLLSLSSQAAIHSRFSNRDTVSSFSPKNSIDSNRFERRSTERVTLPKSISVRSSGYLKVSQPGVGNGGSSSTSTHRLVSEPVQKRVYVPGSSGGGNKTAEEAAVELEVFNQGMYKTELCNKWQETRTCPYSDNCQFAHGMAELRPVIRHPRYKTQVCRMVLAGDVCPYGHRCHFRHSLTEEERLPGPR